MTAKVKRAVHTSVAPTSARDTHPHTAKMATKSAEDQAVYDWIMKTNPPGRSRAQVIGNYDNWSSTYDETLGQGRYGGPRIVAEEAARLVPQDRRQKVRVLDVAAGTGLVGRELLKTGFTNVDAVEPTEGMMKLLKDSGVYCLKYQEFIGLGESTVPHDTYDVVVCCGSVADGHVPLEGMDDMIHFTKPGGVVIIASDLECCKGVDINLSKMESHADHLEQKGLWRKELKKLMPNFFFNEEGLLLSYRVL